MALRYSCTNVAIATGGTELTHGLTHALTGVATAPNEWFFNQRTAATVCGGLYLTAAPGTTSLILAMSSATGNADVFCAIRHTVIS